MFHIMTTGYILTWAFLLSVIWCIGVFYIRRNRLRQSPFFLRGDSGKAFYLPLPVLIVAPPLIWGIHFLFDFSVIYPPVMLLDGSELFLRAFPCAAVLLLGSGLISTIYYTADHELAFWLEKDFIKHRDAMGLNSHKVLRWIVCRRLFLNSWAACLPWFFSELILVEVLFAAPGMGLELWNAMKFQEYSRAWEVALCLLGIYLVMYGANHQAQTSLGKKMRGYL
jgi:ABC-type dipeptide/oligopeptide/nickel transport system permease component